MILSKTAERYGQRPSDLLAIPATPENLWTRLCLDEALSLAHDRHELRKRDRRQYEAHLEKASEGAAGSSNLYTQIMRDPKVGRPPDAVTMGTLNRVSELVAKRRVELGLEPDGGG